METREVFQEKATKTINFIFDSIEVLENRIHHFSDDMKIKFAPQLENLKVRKVELEKELNHLKEATSESWEDAKMGFEKSSDIMHHQLEKMREHFKNHHG